MGKWKEEKRLTLVPKLTNRNKNTNHRPAQIVSKINVLLIY